MAYEKTHPGEASERRKTAVEAEARRVAALDRVVMPAPGEQLPPPRGGGGASAKGKTADPSDEGNALAETSDMAVDASQATAAVAASDPSAVARTNSDKKTSPPIDPVPEEALEQLTPESDATAVRDCRLLLKTLVLGLKTIVWGISSCSRATGGATPGTSGSGGDVAAMNADGPGASAATTTPTPGARKAGGGKEPMSEGEAAIFARLLKNSLSCFYIYSITLPPLPASQHASTQVR